MTHILQDIWTVFTIEIRRVFSNRMTVLVFFVATILYPLAFCAIYNTEAMHDLPVAVVDESHCEASKRFIHKLDALPEVSVQYRCNNMAEARQLMKDRAVHAVMYIPSDYGTRIATMSTARIGVFCDMSSFYYYKNAVTGGSNLLIDEMHTIELERYAMTGLTGQQADEMVQPVVYDDVKLYNPSGGFASFFVPALLMLVLHQTLFFGIGIMSGSAYEDRKSMLLIPAHLRGRSIYRVTFGRALCFILLYIPICAVVLFLIPYLFHLPQLGSLHDIALFLLPFILAVTFFGMSFGNFFVHEKMSGVLCCLFFSVVLFFLSGIVWPQSNMPTFWLAFSYLFPSTPGIEGFVRISSMGATLQEVRGEYLALWIQTAAYFVMACLSFWFVNKYRKA
ncbi:MAG: ABC transporter permease [Bacteroidales bacterium]|nr:ABC transporter permease [Bacteroidales bacterium]